MTFLRLSLSSILCCLALTRRAQALTCAAPNTCQSEADCADVKNVQGMDPICGNAACIAGVCEFTAWNEAGACATDNFVYCAGVDALCTKGPSGLNFEGTCTGWNNQECVYKWCAGDQVGPSTAPPPTTAPPSCNNPCTSASDCHDPANTLGLDEACGSMACVAGTCEFAAWNEAGTCAAKNFLTCASDAACTKGPSELSFQGTCTGWNNQECVYKWCPEDAAPPPTTSPPPPPTTSPPPPPTTSPPPPPTTSPPPPTTTAPPPTNGLCASFDTSELYYLVARHSGMALKVDSLLSASTIVQSPLLSNEEYRWLLQPAENGHYKIVNEATGYFWSLSSSTRGELVRQRATGSSSQENFCFMPDGAEHYSIVNQFSGLVVDIEGRSNADGAPLTQWVDNGGLHQDFQLIPASSTPDPTAPPAPNGCAAFDTSELYFLVARHSGKALEAVTSLPESTIVQFALYYDSTPWQLVPAGNGHYNIVNNRTGLLLSVLTQARGEFVRQREAVSSPRENWCFLPDGAEHYSIINQYNGLLVDIEKRSIADGAPLTTWDDNGGLHQDFQLIPAYFIPPPAPLPGLWESPIISLPLVPVAAGNLPDGKLVLWSAYSRFNFGGSSGQTYSAILDPFTQTYTEAVVQNTNHDMFCPGTAVLPDNRIIITGGSNSEATTIFDPRNGPEGTWIDAPDMKIRRGYHSMTVLSDGSVFTVGGSWSGGQGGKLGEVWDYVSGSWSVKAGIEADPLSTQDDRGIYRADNHMWLFTAPNGKVFHAGPSVMTHWIDTDGNGQVVNSVLRGDDTDSMNGNAVMFDIGKILKVGGAENYDNGPANNRAYVIDINGGEGSVTVQRTGDMTSPRSLCNSVVLPTGKVVIIGGMAQTKLFSDNSAVLAAEMWDPNSGEFTQLDSMTVPRTYHSFAILLKDGRVLAGGGGLCGGCAVNHADAEIFTPPYLLDDNKNPLQRPEIVSAPSNVAVGATFSVEMDTANMHTFALMRLGAATHAVNNDVRRIPLQGVLVNVLGNGNGLFELTVPSNPAVALPGTYFLFAMNVDGVPSVAATVSVLVS